MRLIRSTILLGLLALGISALPAQDQGEDAEAEAPREAPERQPPPDEDGPRPGGDDVFVPTEELDADEEVTFPVDI